MGGEYEGCRFCFLGSFSMPTRGLICSSIRLSQLQRRFSHLVSDYYWLLLPPQPCENNVDLLEKRRGDKVFSLEKLLTESFLCTIINQWLAAHLMTLFLRIFDHIILGKDLINVQRRVQNIIFFFSITKVQYFEMVVPFISLICMLSVSVLVKRGAYEE